MALLVSLITISVNPVLARAKNFQKASQITVDGEVNFVIPDGFELHGSSASDLLFMKADVYEGGLFVAVSESASPSEKDLVGLSRRIVSQLLPQESGFSWRVLPNALIPKFSVHQTNQFTVKAVNEKRFVQTEFILLKVKKRNVVIGLVTQFGSEPESRFLYQTDSRQYSFPGWSGFYQLLDSITGKRSN